MPLGGFRLNTLGQQIAVGPNYGTVGAVAFDAGEYYYDESVTSGYSDTKNMTISYWVKKDSMAARSFVFSKIRSTRRVIAILNTNGSVRWYAQTPNITIDRTSSETGIITAGTWYHVMMSYDGANGTIRCYVNGSALTFTSGVITENITWTFDKLGINTDTNTIGGDSVGNSVAQLYWSNTYQDLSSSTVRERFYNGGWVNMGDAGTSSGADAPMLFHIGDLSTTPAFTTNGGGLTGINYTTVGTPASTTGPVS